MLVYSRGFVQAAHHGTVAHHGPSRQSWHSRHVDKDDRERPKRRQEIDKLNANTVSDRSSSISTARCD